MDKLEVFISKLLPVDGFSSSPISVGKVTTLTHKVGDDSVERRPLVAKSLLSGAKSSEVLRRLGGDVITELSRKKLEVG